MYVHDVEFVAETKAPRTSGDHRAALGEQADAYGLGEGQEAVVYGDGDREVLAAVGELRRLQDAGVVRRVGISGAFLRLRRRRAPPSKKKKKERTQRVSHPGYPLPTLLRLAILVKHTAPYTPLDVVMSYCHLNLQNRTLLDFKTAFERRAGVQYVLAASPLSMGLFTLNPPAWHPASADVREAVKEAFQVSKRPDGASGLTQLALEYAFQKAKEVEIPTVVGFSSLKEVHENARIWHDVDKHGLGEDKEWKQRVQDVRSVLGGGDGRLLDSSWENPRFSR